MQRSSDSRQARRNPRHAFTMIELMVVVTVVAILIGAVFQLMNTIGQMNRKAVTTARLEKLHNAISGFYAEYGYYPPVPNYTNPDVHDTSMKDDRDQNVTGGFIERSTHAARNQPVAFEYPPAKSLDRYVNEAYGEWGLLSPNSNIAGGRVSTVWEWRDLKLFKFGLLSFLLPRVEVVGLSTQTGVVESNQSPDRSFYESAQWRRHNPSSVTAGGGTQRLWKELDAQREQESRTVSRWISNLEGIVAGGGTYFGVNTHDPDTASEGNSFRRFEEHDSEGRLIDVHGYLFGGQKYVLMYKTLRDGWGREFFYYSPPPYQSYQLWSAGPDGKTVPPWLKLSSLDAKERDDAVNATKDDVVRSDNR